MQDAMISVERLAYPSLLMDQYPYHGLSTWGSGVKLFSLMHLVHERKLGELEVPHTTHLEPSATPSTTYDPLCHSVFLQ